MYYETYDRRFETGISRHKKQAHRNHPKTRMRARNRLDLRIKRSEDNRLMKNPGIRCQIMLLIGDRRADTIVKKAP